MLICHLVPHTPPHIHHLRIERNLKKSTSLPNNNNLVLKPMLFPAVLLDLGVDVLHQAVPLHQHVSEGGACEDSHNLRSLLKLFFVQEFFLF